MARAGSYKNEFDRKYNRLMNLYSVGVAERTNDVLLKAIAGLDKILALVEKRGKYNLLTRRRR